MIKKRIACIVLMILLINIGVQPVMAQLTDVPNDHWAYHAVATLVNKGYLAVYEDGTFQGSRAVDRYTLAVTLARILDDIEAGRVQGSIDDLTLISDLTNEFSEELVAWYAEREEFENKLTAAERNMVTTDDRLNRVVAAQTELQEEVQAIKDDLLTELMVEADKLGDLSAESVIVLAEHEKVLDQHSLSLEEQQQILDELLGAVVLLEESLLTQSASVNVLENWAGEKSAVIASMQYRGDEQADEIERLRLGLEDLQASDEDMMVDLQGAKEQVTQLNNRTRELERDMQNLAVLLQRETQQRADLTEKLSVVAAELGTLETQVGISEEELAHLSDQISNQIGLEMNAALIREQRLERQLNELQEEFASYKEESTAAQSSAKTMSMIALVVGAVGIAVGFITGN